jgi:hypothetical protein
MSNRNIIVGASRMAVAASGLAKGDAVILIAGEATTAYIQIPCESNSERDQDDEDLQALMDRDMGDN